MLDSIKEFTGYDLTGMNEDQIREVCGKLNMEIDETMDVKVSSTMKYSVNSMKAITIQPTFITDYPKDNVTAYQPSPHQSGINRTLRINGKRKRVM